MRLTYLQLCQRLVQEAEISGGGPSSVLNQTMTLGRVTKWIKQAWSDIQIMRPNWNFMWEEFSFDLVAGTRDYLAADQLITDLGRWDAHADTRTFLLYLTATGASDEGYIEYRRYRDWRNEYRAGMAARDQGRPTIITALPDKKLRVEPVPDAVYTLSGQYYRTAQVLAVDADLPTGLPDDFHEIIVWQALKYYASSQDGPEVMDEAETKFDDMLLRLEADELPEMSEAYETLA